MSQTVNVITVVATLMTAVATIALAVLTFVYVRVTSKILEAQSNPCVIITVMPESTLLLLVVRNIGTGVAYDVTFEFSQPLPEKAFGMTAKDASEASEMKDGPLINGIPALGPGECRNIVWGQYGGLTAVLGDNSVTAICKFKKNKGKEMPPIECPLDVKSFAGTAIINDATEKIEKHIEKISKTVQSGVLKVEVVALPEAQR